MSLVNLSLLINVIHYPFIKHFIPHFTSESFPKAIGIFHSVLYIIFSIVWINGNVLAQDNLRFKQLTTEDGFAAVNSLYGNSIIKDSEGFIWISTPAGLSRFDGETFKNYSHDPSDSNSIGRNLLTALHEDRNGKIWVGTISKGIYIFNKELETFSPFIPDLKKADNPLTSSIWFIREDQQGNIWYGGQLGVNCWNRTTGEVEDFDGYFKAAFSFYQQKSGTIWIGDTNGIHFLSAGSNQFKKPVNNIKTGTVTDILELENGNLLIASSPNFWEFDMFHHKFYDLKANKNLPNNFIPIELKPGRNGDIWMSDFNSILRYNQRSENYQLITYDENKPLGIPQPGYENILVDSFNNLFVLTGVKGLAVAHANPHPFKVIGDIKALDLCVLDHSNVLIRGFDQGGLIYDTQKGTLSLETLPITPGNIYTPSLAIQGDSLLWFWNPKEIKSYHLKTGRIETAPKNPKHNLYLNIDNYGRLWNGLSYLDPIDYKWIDFIPELICAFPELEKVPYSYATVFFDDKNNLWTNIDGAWKIFRFNLETKDKKVYPVDGSSFFRGSNGRFYINTAEGLAYYDVQKDSFLYLTKKEGLMYTSAFSAVDDKKGNSWIATAKGIQKYDWKTLSFTSIDFEDGFPSSGISAVRSGMIDADGYLYFNLNLEKIFRFHPDSLNINEETGSIYIMDFYLNQKLLNAVEDSSTLDKKPRFKEKVNLNYLQSDIGFSFTMPSFYKSEHTEYFYRLEPYQNEWLSNGTRNVVHYTNLLPGNYTFRVKAKSASGNWSNNEAFLKIHISPPWWQTWWARVLFLLFLTGIVIGIWKYELKRRLSKSEAIRLKEMDTLKTRLYTNITHEFRTPLTVILGMADNLNEQQHERHLIRRNSKNLLRLVNQLLDLSKLDSGSMKMDLVQGDVINYLRYLTESFHSIAQEKQIRLSFNSEIDELIMDFDEVKIQHVIYNLLSNALKFTPIDGQVILHIGQITNKGVSHLQLRVSDTGIGIREDNQKYIFDRFYQADSSTTRKGEGTGIGLALTKELVKMMGGDIRLESRLGQGTHFTINLPIKLHPNTPMMDLNLEMNKEFINEIDSTVIASKNLQELIHTSGDLPQLLLIEDNKDVAIYIETLLKKDFRVTKAINGREGIELALSSIPDIIISDVMMPEKDGFEVCQTLKTDERTSHIPIILLTARAEQKDKVTGLQHGADAYLMKPFHKEELLVRLEKLLELRKALLEKYSQGVSFPTEPSLEDIFLQKVYDVIETHIDDTSFTVTDLCRILHLSKMQLYRKLKALTGTTPTLFIRSYRLSKALHLLKTTDHNISEIAYNVGFSDPAYFSRAFKEEFNTPPSNIRN